MPSRLGRNLDKVINNIDLARQVPLNDNAPEDPAAFYADFGYLKHPLTRKPVATLAPYQLEAWQGLQTFKRVLVIKSNKVGLSTSTLMAGFQLAVLPSSHPMSCRGYDQLLIAQTIQHAKEHLYTLRKLIMSSRKYRPWLITKPTDMVLKDEATKVTVLYIRNPDNENQPSRIIGLGLNNAGSILSWKQVKHIHISDPTAAEGDYSEAINAAMTRLANTDGSMIIETIPSGPAGRIYDMYRQYDKTEWKPGDFKVYLVTADQAVQAGVITADFIEAERKRLGIMFARYYEAMFMAGAGNIYLALQVDLCSEKPYDLAVKDGYKIMAVDPGFGSSKFAIIGVERIGDVTFVKEAKQFDRPSPTAMIETVAAIYHRDRYSTCLVDSSQPGIILDLANGSEQRRPLNVEAVNFREKLSEMTLKSSAAVKEMKARIHPSFTELIMQLKAVQFNENGHPDKKRLTFDLGDAFMMAVSKSEAGAGGITIVVDKGWTRGQTSTDYHSNRDWLWQ